MKTNRTPLTLDELATGAGLPRSFDTRPAPADYFPRMEWVMRYEIQEQRFLRGLFNGAPDAARLVIAIALSVLAALVLS